MPDPALNPAPNRAPSPASFDLTGRVAVVTGAGAPDGIGHASAVLLGELGAAVLVAATTDRVHERVDDLRERGVDAAGFVGDLTGEDEAVALVQAATDRWGRLDVLVNNAGMTSVAEPDMHTGGVSTVTLGAWHASLRRNLDTAFLVSRAATPVMVAAGWGRVVMVSSVTGPVMAVAGDLAYAAAKAGMVGLMRALAMDVARAGVTVNAVAPGWIATGSQTPDEQEQGTLVPLTRSGTPDEVASAVAWLASPGASYVTGQCVVVDGGNSVDEARARGTGGSSRSLIA